MVNELIKKRADIGTTPFEFDRYTEYEILLCISFYIFKVMTDLTITPQRKKVISFASTLFRYKMVLAIKTPSPSLNLLTYLAPFHFGVWSIIFLLFCIVLPTFMHFTTK